MKQYPYQTMSSPSKLTKYVKNLRKLEKGENGLTLKVINFYTKLFISLNKFYQ